MGVELTTKRTPLTAKIQKTFIWGIIAIHLLTLLNKFCTVSGAKAEVEGKDIGPITLLSVDKISNLPPFLDRLDLHCAAVIIHI